MMRWDIGYHCTCTYTSEKYNSNKTTTKKEQNFFSYKNVIKIYRRMTKPVCVCVSWLNNPHSAHHFVDVKITPLSPDYVETNPLRNFTIKIRPPKIWRTLKTPRKMTLLRIIYLCTWSESWVNHQCLWFTIEDGGLRETETLLTGLGFGFEKTRPQKIQ